jgi:molybdopterin molybdotransferase
MKEYSAGLLSPAKSVQEMRLFFSKGNQDKMINYNEANSIIEREFKKLRLETETVDLINSINRILAEDIHSDIDLPPFTNSGMDGYAVQFNRDIRKWKIIGEISSGNYREFNLGNGEAVSIMTGGRMPQKADTVIPIEDVSLENDFIILKENTSFIKGINVREKGNDLLKGKIAVSKNTILKPKHIAVAASCGKSKLEVYKKIRTAVLATGDELIDIYETPRDDKIRSSNLYALLSAIDDIHQTGINFGITGDNKKEITEKLKSFLHSDIDILITTGGVSAGKYDFVDSLMEEVGINIHFRKANIKPGMPVVFGTYSDGERIKFIFGLPGNPVSCLVSFYIFIKKNLMGLFNINEDDFFSAELAEDIRKYDGKLHFMRGRYVKDSDGTVTVKRVGLQSSGNLAEMGRSNCLIIFNEEKREMKSGDKVICIPI